MIFKKNKLPKKISLKYRALIKYAQKIKAFDHNFYRYSNKDLNLSNTDQELHFWNSDSSDIRKPNLIFDPKFYHTIYPDILDSKVNPLLHYLNDGFNENRLCHEIFYPKDYLNDRYPDEEPSLEQLFDDYHSGVLFDNPKLRFNLCPVEFKIAKLMRSIQAINKDISIANKIIFAPESDPKVSIIIPVYNQLKYTLNCLTALSLDLDTAGYEIIVIDDCSNDASENTLSKIQGLKYIRNDQNLGFLKSCNKAATLAKGEFLIFLNNDTCPIPGWSKSLLETFVTHHLAGLVGAKLVYPDGRLQEAGGLIWQDGSGTNCGKFQNADHPDYNYLREVDYCSGAAIMTPKIIWDKIGGFDPQYAPAYYEDTDYAFAVRDLGYKVLYQPTAQVLHFEGITCGSDLSSGVKSYQVINQQKFIKKWQKVLNSHSPVINHQELYSHHKKPKALVIDQKVPQIDQDAGSVYTYNNLKILTKYFQVDFLNSWGVNHEGKYSVELSDIGVRHIYGPWFHRHLFEEMPFKWKEIELVVLHRFNVCNQFIDKLKDLAPQAKILFINHDIHFYRLNQQALIENSKKVKQLAKRVQGEELSALVKSDVSIVLGAWEKEYLLEFLPKLKCYQLPFAENVVSSVTPFMERNNIFFVGGFNHPPNVDAVIYFLEEVWPIVEKALPGVKFYIFGSKMPKRLKDYASESVIPHGYVENLEEIYQTFRVNVAPMRIGAGQNGKVVKGLCHGLPMVVSSICAKGIGVENNLQVMVSDDPKDFAEKVINLYQNQETWNYISNSSIKFAKEHLSFEAGEAILKDIFRELDLFSE